LRFVIRFRLARRRSLLAIALILCVAASGTMRAQEPSPAAATGAAQNAPIPGSGRAVSWWQLPSDVLHDQRGIWLFPTKVAGGQHLFPTFAVVGVTGALIATDPHDAPYFRRTDDFQRFNRVFSGKATGLAAALMPLSVYAVGLMRQDSYQQETSLLAGEALADSLILATAMKVSTQRLRPSDIPPQGDFSDTFFRGHSISSVSFPSGHTIAAFSVATVFARRYRNHRWVPWLAYGAAGVIGFSRISLQAHFPSDVFLGAALGYSISRFAVLRP
jgi:membrane-associated phospholipid phosphatase